MNKKQYLLLLLAAILLLNGCSLARPAGAQASQDTFIGIYLVGASDSLNAIDEWRWTALDSEAAKTVFPAEYDSEAKQYRFPGVEGFAMFAALNEDALYLSNDFSDAVSHISETDLGTSYDLSGTLYASKAAADWVWSAYNVYQSEDGTVYLDGSCSSFSGYMTMTVTGEYSATVDGQDAVSHSCTAVITLAEALPLTRLLVRQYGADGQLLATSELPLTEDPQNVAWEPDAQWALVEEVFTGSVKHTAYDRPEEAENPVTHTIVLLDSDGIGHASSITIK